MNDYALVLAGGGAKGAYQIGVWRALREFSADRLIGAVAGTSVGSLNGALYISGEYKKALSLWQNIRHDDILTTSQVSGSMSRENIFSSLLKDNILTRIKAGIFSRSGLSEIIRSNLNFNAVRRSKLPLYVTLFNIKSLSAEYIRIFPYDSNERIEKLLLASSSIPVIFPPEVIGGRSYYDGGVADNCPIKPLYKDGYRKFIVVWLSHDVSSNISEHRVKFPDAEIINIIPSEEQGNLLTGTLDFSLSGISRRLELGYYDTAQVLCSAFGGDETEDSKRISAAKKNIRKIARAK